MLNPLLYSKGVRIFFQERTQHVYPYVHFPSDSTQQCFGCLSPMYPDLDSTVVLMFAEFGLQAYTVIFNVIWYDMPHVIVYHSQLCFLERAIKEN